MFWGFGLPFSDKMEEMEELPSVEIVQVVLQKQLLKLEPEVITTTNYESCHNVGVQVGLVLGGQALKKGKHVFLLNQVKPSVIYESYTDPDVHRIVKKKIPWKKFNIGVKEHVGIFIKIDKSESYGKEDHRIFNHLVKSCILECCECVRPLMGKSSYVSELRERRIAAIRLADPVCRCFRFKNPPSKNCPINRAKSTNHMDSWAIADEIIARARARASLCKRSCSDSGGKNISTSLGKESCSDSAGKNSSISLDKESCSDYAGKKRKLR